MKLKEKNLPVSNRSFGIVFFIFFILVSLWPLLKNEEIRFWSIYISIVFLILGLINSKFLTPLNKSWYKLGIFLGTIISPIVMGIIFFTVLTPIGFILRLMGKDLLKLKKKENIKTYWIKKIDYKTSMKKQF